jgi:hypothetical protein
MSEERKQVWPWFVALLIALLLLYVASFGPACWTVSRFGNERIVNVAYRPVIWIWDNTALPVGGFLRWYSRLGAEKGWIWRHWNIGSEGSEARWERRWERQR